MEPGQHPGLARRHGGHSTRGRRSVTLVLAGLALLITGGAAASAHSELFPGAGRPALGKGVSALDPRSPLTLDVPAEGLMPGGTARARHVIANTAGLSLRYALVSTSTDPDGNGLRDLLHVTITACDGVGTTPLYAGPLGPATAGFGDPRIGAQPGDRELGPGDRISLCFELTMPREAGNEYQGATTWTTWTLASEQVAGNP